MRQENVVPATAVTAYSPTDLLFQDPPFQQCSCLGGSALASSSQALGYEAPEVVSVEPGSHGICRGE